ncbi:hypothetical protein PGT21_012998 [Puccinia graminis f. sp. tritici]|nr:hypothetical protein PGT21_012998 [Puccinia graminis f. sp. tritici]
MHIGLPHNHLKLTVSTASHLSIEYYLSLKAYFESPRKHFAKTNKEIPTQLTIEKLPVIVGDRNLAQAQLAVDQIGPVPHLSHPTNDLSSPPPSPSALLQNAIPPQPPSQQQRSSSYGAQDWKHSQWAQNHPRSQLPPRTSLQTLPKVLADPTHHHQQNLRRSFQGQLPYAIPLGLSQPGRPHKFSSSSNPFTGLSGNVPPLPTRQPTTSLQAQSPPIRSPLKEIFLQPTCAPELSPTSQDFYPSSELQTPTRQPSYPHHPTQLVRSLSSPNSETPHQSSSSSHPTNIHPTSFGSGDEKARLFARAKAEAAMNQARLHHATFSSLCPPHLGSAEPAAGEGSSSHYTNPTYHPTNRELEAQMPRNSIQNYHPLDTRFKSLTNLAIHEEGLSEVATIATLPQYHPSSNHSDHHLIQSDQDHHPRRFSSSRLYDLPPPNLSSSQEMDRRSSSPPPPPVNLRTRPSIVNGKSRAEGLIEHDRLNLSSSSSCPINPRVSRSVPPAVIESPPPTLIDPQREAYLKAVAERERFFMNSTHDDASYRNDDHFRAYEVETNLPTHVLSALEEKNRLRHLWMASLDPSSNPAPPPFHYPSHSFATVSSSSSSPFHTHHSLPPPPPPPADQPVPNSDFISLHKKASDGFDARDASQTVQPVSDDDDDDTEQQKNDNPGQQQQHEAEEERSDESVQDNCSAVAPLTAPSPIESFLPDLSFDNTRLDIDHTLLSTQRSSSSSSSSHVLDQESEKSSGRFVYDRPARSVGPRKPLERLHEEGRSDVLSTVKAARPSSLSTLFNQSKDLPPHLADHLHSPPPQLPPSSYHHSRFLDTLPSLPGPQSFSTPALDPPTPTPTPPPPPPPPSSSSDNNNLNLNRKPPQVPPKIPI